MDTEKFETGTIIKGSKLREYTLCKILSDDMCMREFQYQIGINVDVSPLGRFGSYKAGYILRFFKIKMERI